jgi:hypothetical protein
MEPVIIKTFSSVLKQEASELVEKLVGMSGIIEDYYFKIRDSVLNKFL